MLLGPPGTGKTMLATGLGIKACQAGHRVLFAAAATWTDRLTAAHRASRLQAEIARLGRYPLLVIDEIGYIPFEPEVANLFFQLISARYETANVIVTSNKAFSGWGEIFGDDTVAAAMIDNRSTHGFQRSVLSRVAASQQVSHCLAGRSEIHGIWPLLPGFLEILV